MVCFQCILAMHLACFQRTNKPLMQPYIDDKTVDRAVSRMHPICLVLKQVVNGFYDVSFAQHYRNVR